MRKAQACLMLAALAALVCALAGSAPAAEQVLTVDQVVKIALERNPTLEASREVVAQAASRLTQTKSRWWPQVTGTLDYSRNYTESQRQASNYGGDNYNYYSSGLSLSQKIYDFGQTGGLVEQSRQALASTRSDHTTNISGVVQQVKNAFYQVLKNQGLVEVARQTLASQLKHLEQAQAFYKGGLRPKIDVTRAEVDVANARLSLINTVYAERDSRVALERILGGPPVKGSYKLAPEKQQPARPRKLTPLVIQAQMQRPEVASLQALIKAAQGKLEAAQGGYWPSLDASGAYNYQNDEFPLENNWTAGVGLTWALFSGFLTEGQVNEARALILQQKARLKDLELQIAQEVQSAYLALGQADERIATSRTALANAEENMRLAEGRYRTGVGNAIEYTDAQVALTAAQNNLVQATYDYFQAWANLEKAMGRVQPYASMAKLSPSAN
ncbi:MAG: TolC family protein [Thermodesulfobacteriota bacterium]